MFASYEETNITPQFDPLDPDVPLEASLESFDTDERRQAYRRLVEERSVRRSLNFTNVRKEKVKQGANSHIYDIENFSFSYAYSDQVSSNINTQILLRKQQSAGVNYNFSSSPIVFKPFANMGLGKIPIQIGSGGKVVGQRRNVNILDQLKIGTFK
jgi:cell surface protein SprA